MIDTVVILLIIAALCILIWLYMIAPAPTPESARRLTGYKFAHRGLFSRPKRIPENSMQAFCRAARRGYGIELDIHLTRDGDVAVIHDTSLLRTAGKDVPVTELSVTEIKSYFLEKTGERIPMLAEVLSEIRGSVPLLIELKVDDNNFARLCDAAMAKLRDYKGEYALQSFDPRAVRYLKKRYPHIIRGQLAGFLRRGGDNLHRFLDFGLRNLLSNFLTRPHFISYRVQDSHEFSISVCRKLFHPPEFNWTIRSAEEMKQAEENGAIAIFESE